MIAILMLLKFVLINAKCNNESCLPCDVICTVLPSCLQLCPNYYKSLRLTTLINENDDNFNPLYKYPFFWTSLLSFIVIICSLAVIIIMCYRNRYTLSELNNISFIGLRQKALIKNALPNNFTEMKKKYKKIKVVVKKINNTLIPKKRINVNYNLNNLRPFNLVETVC